MLELPNFPVRLSQHTAPSEFHPGCFLNAWLPILILEQTSEAFTEHLLYAISFGTVPTVALLQQGKVTGQGEDSIRDTSIYR